MYFWTLQRGSNNKKSINCKLFCHGNFFLMTFSELPPKVVSYNKTKMLCSIRNGLLKFWKQIHLIWSAICWNIELKRTYTFITFSLEWCATVRTNILQTNPENCLVEALKKNETFRTSDIGPKGFSTFNQPFVRNREPGRSWWVRRSQRPKSSFLPRRRRRNCSSTAAEAGEAQPKEKIPDS